ncbi:MAG: hypothetical protein LCH95_22345, partial [Proteobacteria bacterium]|nr:hypothetical protein [Pseudomonadota bacterium]
MSRDIMAASVGAPRGPSHVLDQAQKKTAGQSPAVPEVQLRIVLLDDDLDAAVLRLADAVGGLHEQ